MTRWKLWSFSRITVYCDSSAAEAVEVVGCDAAFFVESFRFERAFSMPDCAFHEELIRNI
jgi:hypothetical protein